MNRHALGVLEFDRVLAVVGGFASSPAGAARVAALTPVDDVLFLEAEQGRVAAMRAFVTSEPTWHPEPIPDITRPLERLRIEGTAWSGTELLGGLTLLRSSRLTIDALRDPRRPGVAVAVLGAQIARLVSSKTDEAAIERAIGDDGGVRDDASPALRRIRRELRSAEGELIALLERIVSRLEPHQQVADASVTVRNGRYVIPLRRDARAVVGGIVHDTSSTGATLFVEPPAAVEFGNRIRELEIDGQREVDRILLELTDRLRPLHERLVSALDALIELDALYARARFAVDYQCAPVTFAEPGTGFAIHHGRHPLLVAQGIPVVPFDLAMTPSERTLLVSGPNTGGKTVLLKTLGLISALLQAGVPAPVGPESRVSVFDDLFADVGDEQSIEASLSTFSAHLKNLGEILRAAGARSLVLVDELGSGTDPLEGAALGGAILEELTRRGAFTAATTHLGALKELALEVPGVVNASLQFDAVALAPTYRLIKGIPGRSYGLSIARRLALPEDVLARAEERLPTGERDVNALLGDLARRDSALAEREIEVASATDELRDLTEQLTERERQIRDRERAVERESRRDARRFLLDARSDVERIVRELKAATKAEVEVAARAARQDVERLAAEQGESLDRLDRLEQVSGERTTRKGEPMPGDFVEVDTLGGRSGRMLERRDDEAVIAVGALKLTVPLSAVRLTNARAESEPEIAVPIRGDIPEPEATTEIDLRGQRAGDIDEIVFQALDAAVRAELPSLRIIHGKGTGALRQRVAEMLRKDTRVKHFRLGAWNEGGAGVTVAELG